nr:phage tail protein [Citrobacter freundii]
MATKYLALLTNIGAAKLAKATALGTKVEITQLAVGDGNGVLPTPNPAQTALVHELRRAPLNMLTVDPANASQIIAEQVIPEDVGGWWIREIGLFDKDGDMVAIANCAETYKPQLQEGSGRVQVIRVILIVSSTEAVTLKIDPAVVLATRQYVDSQLRAHEQSRNHPDASTTEKGFVQLSSSVTSDSESQAATSKAVKIAMDNANARLAKERNLADLPNPALARQNLQLGNSSTKNIGTTADTVAAGDDARITGAMQKNQNGGDIPDVAKFLQNLGLRAFISHPSSDPGAFSQVNSPDGSVYLFIANNDGWGAQKADGTSIPLPLERGGSGAGTASGARTAFGLGDSATKNVGTTAGTVAAGDDSRLVNLKSAANRSVGNGANQIPDMSYFTTGETSAGRWAKLPSGLIIQAGFGLTGSAGTASVNLPIPFTGTFWVVGGSIEGNGPIFVSARGLTQSTIGVVAWGRDGSIQVTNMHWLAIGV